MRGADPGGHQLRQRPLRLREGRGHRVPPGAVAGHPGRVRDPRDHEAGHRRGADPHPVGRPLPRVARRLARGPHRPLLRGRGAALHRRTAAAGLPGARRPLRAGVLRTGGGGRDLLRAGPERQPHGGGRRVGPGPAVRGHPRGQQPPGRGRGPAHRQADPRRAFRTRLRPRRIRGRGGGRLPVAPRALPRFGPAPLVRGHCGGGRRGAAGLPQDIRLRGAFSEPGARLHGQAAPVVQRALLRRLGAVKVSWYEHLR